MYYIQSDTKKIVEVLKSLAPEGVTFNSWFEEIYKEGTGKTFEMEHNKEWMKHTRPMVEAFFHANFFLKMALKCGKEMDTAPNMLPSDWAALLYFYELR